MLDAPFATPPVTTAILPRPPMPTRERTQVESFLVLRRNPLELWGALAYEHDILGGRFLGREQLMLNAPDAIRHVLVVNHENYGRNVGARRVLQPLLGRGLFLAEGAAWRHQRRTIAPAMSPRSMPVLARHVVTATRHSEATLDGLTGQPIVLMPYLQHLALHIAGQSMFSLEMAGFGTDLRALLMEYARRFAQPGALDLLLPIAIPSPLDVGRGKFRAGWLRFIDRLIDARAEQAPAEGGPRDLLDMLSAARDPDTGAVFSRAQLRDEVATMILAGHETTAVTLFWACYIAARLPDQQDRLAVEAAAADLSEDGAADGLRSLPLIRAHIDEALRLYPPAFLIVREALAPDVIAGRRVAAGTVVSVSPWVLHRHRKLWEDPERFDPARFEPGAPPPDRYSYVPFGAGPRICVGAQFALTEATLVLARLLRSFRIRFAGRGAVMPRGFVTTQPDRPVHFVLERRT